MLQESNTGMPSRKLASSLLQHKIKKPQKFLGFLLWKSFHLTIDKTTKLCYDFIVWLDFFNHWNGDFIMESLRVAIKRMRMQCDEIEKLTINKHIINQVKSVSYTHLTLPTKA